VLWSEQVDTSQISFVNSQREHLFCFERRACVVVITSVLLPFVFVSLDNDERLPTLVVVQHFIKLLLSKLTLVFGISFLSCSCLS
jgi:hypothetical protein